VAPVRLVACPDDYLLEESLKEAAAGACAALGVEAETLPEDSAPADVAYEVRSPSLFAPARVLVVAHAGPWVAATPRRRGARNGADEGLDASLLEPLVEVVADGVPDEVALILGACCAREPKGPLADAIKASSTGTLDWLPLPADPKPWEETLLSDQQTAALRGLLARVVPEARFQREAGDLLLERLGFAPRRLVAEARKLATASGGAPIGSELVRRLVLPRERSTEVVRDAVLGRSARPVLEVLEAAARGEAVRDWRGEEIAPGRVAGVVLGQVSNLLAQLLAVHRLAVACGLEGEMDPSRTGDRGWYRSVFQRRLLPALEARLAEGAGDLLSSRGGKAPSPWVLQQLFRGSGRYDEVRLVTALAEAAHTEVALRGPGELEVLAAWIGRHLGQVSA